MNSDFRSLLREIKGTAAYLLTMSQGFQALAESSTSDVSKLTHNSRAAGYIDSYHTLLRHIGEFLEELQEPSSKSECEAFRNGFTCSCIDAEEIALMKAEDKIDAMKEGAANE